MSQYIKILSLGICICLTACANSQDKTHGIKTIDPEFNQKIDNTLDFRIPVISVQDLKENFDEYLILDAREKEEYNVSHIRSALYLGYDHPDWSILDEIQNDKKLVVYCSIGYRSERIGKKLADKGYQVVNLYGSIFEWANQGYPLYKNNVQVKELHSFNKKWSKWISNPDITTIY